MILAFDWDDRSLIAATWILYYGGSCFSRSLSCSPDHAPVLPDHLHGAHEPEPAFPDHVVDFLEDDLAVEIEEGPEEHQDMDIEEEDHVMGFKCSIGKTRGLLSFFRGIGVICEDMLKGAYFGAKTKTFEDYSILTNTSYLGKEIRRISAKSSQENAYEQFPIRYQQIRRIHQLDMSHRPFQSEQRNDLYNLNNIYVLPNNTTGSEHEDANEHREKVFEIVDLFHIPKVTQDQVMLQVFQMSLTGATSRWLRNEPSGSIKNWETLKTKFMNKYCPPARTAKKMEEINNFQQEPDESLFRAWERFKELYMQEVILFYNGLDVPTRQILDSKGAIPTKTVADAKIAIQEMAEYSQEWHNETSSKTKSTETSDGLTAIQAQLNNLGREIKKVNEKVYVAQVGCELCKGPHCTKDCPLKEERNTLEEAYWTQQTLKESLTKFMAESAKRHEENSNIIKEIRASIDAAIRNQRASIKTLEIQIGQMSKVLQERGIGGLPGSTKLNPMDHVNSILTTKADSSEIRRMGCSSYIVSGSQHISIFFEAVPFLRRLQNYCCDDWREAQDIKILEAYVTPCLRKKKT
nr:hypothetical protein [Tanacetum cinerariifolium]